MKVAATIVEPASVKIKSNWKWQENITQDSTSQKIIHNSVKTYDILIK